MHSEEIRARQAARSFRESIGCTGFVPADDVLSAAERFTGFSRSILPGDDPLLSGADALLDRDFLTIWINQDRPLLNQFADAAHEYGHLVLHGAEPTIQDDEPIEFVAGYSKNQRDERDAHLFAAEFLLPLDAAKEQFLSGKSASLIAKNLKLARKLVVRQLIASFATSDALFGHSTGPLELDRWQLDAAIARCPTLVIGSRSTGKTTVLVGRCEHLCVTGVEPSRILLVADSRDTASLLREKLLISGNRKLTLVPVTTVRQFAYDLLVRFPQEANLEPGWEEMTNDLSPDSFITHALKLVKSNPEVGAVIHQRYDHFLVDNIDRLGPDSLEFVLSTAAGSGLWATAGRGGEIALDHRLTFSNQFSLPYQYRTSETILDFRQRLLPAGEKREISRRKSEPPCGSGSVTIAVAATPEQEIAGIAEYVNDKLQIGYTIDDILIVVGGGSINAAWKTKLSAQIGADSEKDEKGEHADDLKAILNLCSGEWSEKSVIRAGSMKHYNVPGKELLSQSLNRTSPGYARLLKDITLCRSARTLKEALLLYLFDISDCLRVMPEMGVAVPYVLRDLAVELGNVRFVGSRALSRRTSPVILFHGADLEALYAALCGKGASPTTTGAAEIAALDASQDHVLFSATTTDGRDWQTAKRIAAIVPTVKLIDWRDTGSGESVTYSSRPHAPVILDNAEKLLFAQCPRRVYYGRLLSLKSDDRIEDGIKSADFVASPADPALCDMCRYTGICPTELH